VIVSFFNELDTGKELCSRPLFHFLTSLPQRRETMLVVYARGLLLDHGFQEDNALEGYHVKGQNVVMASKRSSLDGR
jgi:hypothetical protein